MSTIVIITPPPPPPPPEEEQRSSGRRESDALVKVYGPLPPRESLIAAFCDLLERYPEE